METLIIDCSAGARKELLLNDLFAMLDADNQAKFLNAVTEIDPHHDCVTVVEYSDGVLKIDGMTEAEAKAHKHDYEHGHNHEAGHGHPHEHHSVDEVHACIDALNVSDNVKADAYGVYDVLAQAEAKAHGVALEDVHFHEVGNVYAIMSIVAICLLIEMLDADRIVSTPITTGFGYIDCAHGRLAIPAPATVNILDGLPVVRGDVEGELTTPTGAAIIKYFIQEFIS